MAVDQATTRSDLDQVKTKRRATKKTMMMTRTMTRKHRKLQRKLPSRTGKSSKDQMANQRSN